MFCCSGARFSSSGREDVDVRTLGIGRPFLFEILNPRKVNFTPEELEKIEQEINSSTEKIRVRRLAIVPK
jgi:tRNA pseudouridine synthase 10